VKKQLLVISLLMLALNVQARQQSGQVRKEMKGTPKESLVVSVQGLPLLIGGIGAEVDYRLSRKLSILMGGMIVNDRSVKASSDDSSSSTSNSSYKMSAHEIYIGPKLMFSSDFNKSGGYVSGGIGHMGTSIKEYSSFDLSGSVSGFEVRGVIGYQWALVSGFRINAGGGLRMIQDSDIVVKDSSDKEVLRTKSSSLGGLALDASIGYMF
jgi:hypothetical protein